MLWKIVTSVISFFSALFRLLQGFFGWVIDKTWALFLAIVTPLLSLFWSLLDTFKSWMLSVAGLELSDQNLSKSFADIINSCISSLISGDSVFSHVAADIVDIVNLGTFISSVLVVVLPVLIAVFTYRVVKSWVPTVSGG